MDPKTANLMIVQRFKEKVRQKKMESDEYFNNLDKNTKKIHMHDLSDYDHLDKNDDRYGRFRVGGVNL